MATPGRSPNDKEAAAKGKASSPKNLAKKKKDEEWDEDEEEDEDEDEGEEDEEEEGEEDEDGEDEDWDEDDDEDLEDEDFDDEDFDDEDFDDDEDLDEDDEDDEDLDDDEEDEDGEEEELKKGGKTKKAAPARATSRAKPPPADPVAAAGAKTSNLYRNVSAAKEEPAKDAKRSRFGASVAGSSSAAGASSKRSTARASGVNEATGRASGRASGRGSQRPPKRDNFKLIVILVCLLMLLACIGLGLYLVLNKPEPKGPTVINRDPGKEVKESHAKARTLANKARDAMKEEKLEEALQLYKDAKMALDDCAVKIEMFREDPKFSGEEYAGWETIGQGINSDLYLVNDEIFKIENRINNEKRKAQESANPQPETPPDGGGAKTDTPAPAEQKTPASGGDEFGPDAERGPTPG